MFGMLDMTDSKYGWLFQKWLEDFNASSVKKLESVKSNLKPETVLGYT